MEKSNKKKEEWFQFKVIVFIIALTTLNNSLEMFNGFYEIEKKQEEKIVEEPKENSNRPNNDGKKSYNDYPDFFFAGFRFVELHALQIGPCLWRNRSAHFRQKPSDDDRFLLCRQGLE